MAGKPAAYEDLSVPLFAQGYLIVIKGEKETVKAKMAAHLADLMGDAERYGWERVRAYHGVWLNQLELGRATWENEEKVRFQCALVWHPTTSASSAPSTSAVLGVQKQTKLGFAYNAPVRLGTKACKAFNVDSCTNTAAHPNQLHFNEAHLPWWQWHMVVVLPVIAYCWGSSPGAPPSFGIQLEPVVMMFPFPAHSSR